MPDSSRRCGDPDGAFAVEEDACGERLGLNAQIGAAPRRIQESARCRPAAAIFLRRLEIAETFLVAVVVIRIAREALGHCGLDEGIGELGVFAQSGNVQRTAAAAGIISAWLVMFRFFEIGEHRLV
jgi:hypothetical protein